jgi:hypothetical protein
VISGNTIRGNSAAYYAGGILLSEHSSPDVVGNAVRENSAYLGGAVVCLEGSHPYFENNDFRANVADSLGGLYVADSSDPIFYHNNFRGNGYGLWNEDDRLILDAEENYWGHATGPYHPTINPTGLGDEVSDHVDFEPWASVPSISEELADPETMSPPTAFSIRPNPARGSALLSVHRSTGSDPVFHLFDISGRRLLTLEVPSPHPSGTILLDLVDPRGRPLSKGLYILRLEGSPYRIPLVILD